MKYAKTMLNFGAFFVRSAVVAVIAVSVLPWARGGVVEAGQTPSLADVARKEQERRKTQKGASKPLTNKDLPDGGRGAGTARPVQPPPPEPTPAKEAKPPEPEPSKEAKEEAFWRQRIAQAREELRRNEVFAEALQTRINSLSADFVNRDDPYQRAKIGADRDKAIAELGRVKADIERGKKLIEDIEEEARKAGVPPGWLR
jgi:hypothetical protein